MNAMVCSPDRDTDFFNIVIRVLQGDTSAIMILYKNMNAIVCSPDRDTDFFNIVIRVLQGDTSASYLLIICLDYIHWISIGLIKENGFTFKKKQEADDILQKL